ncbi:hypothetical protein P5Y53_21130 [Dyella jiangningensis]|uniref:hypothetical protein n=1 Tax=Dyella jiangningensis TaxID=1379159 RepID=UPI00240FC2B3|nr:hypothetical protein [Dyella jiangningensis]MDG2540195.1 hypothetical protein [Dyella jiangningensis]
MLSAAFALRITGHWKVGEFHPGIRPLVHAVPMFLRHTGTAVLDHARDDLPQPRHGLKIARIGMTGLADQCCGEQHQQRKGARNGVPA